MKGISHNNVGDEITKSEWAGVNLHGLSDGTSFPGTPSEMDFFYRTDEHKWYIYNGTDWMSLGG